MQPELQMLESKLLELVIAALSSQHGRLGEGSPLRKIPLELLRRIIKDLFMDAQITQYMREQCPKMHAECYILFDQILATFNMIKHDKRKVIKPSYSGLKDVKRTYTAGTCEGQSIQDRYNKMCKHVRQYEEELSKMNQLRAEQEGGFP